MEQLRKNNLKELTARGQRRRAEVDRARDERLRRAAAEAARRAAAAKTLSRAIRGHSARQREREQGQAVAATSIQRGFRRALARGRDKQRQALNRESRAAVLVQSAARMFLARAAYAELLAADKARARDDLVRKRARERYSKLYGSLRGSVAGLTAEAVQRLTRLSVSGTGSVILPPMARGSLAGRGGRGSLSVLEPGGAPDAARGAASSTASLDSSSSDGGTSSTSLLPAVALMLPSAQAVKAALAGARLPPIKGAGART